MLCKAMTSLEYPVTGSQPIITSELTEYVNVSGSTPAPVALGPPSSPVQAAARIASAVTSIADRTTNDLIVLPLLRGSREINPTRAALRPSPLYVQQDR